MPGAADNAYICAGITVNININSACNNLYLQGGTINYPNNNRTLTVNGNITVTTGPNFIIGEGTGRTLNVSGMLIISSEAILDIAGQTVTVNGTSTIDGDLSFSSNIRVKTFIGQVTIGATGSWTSITVTTTGNLVFRNGIVSNGTSFSAGGATFNTNGQSLSGSTALSFANVVTVTVVTVTNNTTVNMTSTSAGAFTGTGTFLNSTNSTFNYSGATITITNLSASASGNTINYNRSDGLAQTIFNPISSVYFHLILSGSGTKTLSASADVNGNLSIQGTAVFSVNNFDILLAGNWNNSSTAADPFTEGTGRVTFDGSSPQTISNTGNANGTVFNAVRINNSWPATAITLETSITINGTLTLTDGHIITSSVNILNIGSVALAPVLGGTPQDSSFVKGPMRHNVATAVSETKIYPVGKSTSYRRLDLTIDQNAPTATYYEVEMIPGAPPANALPGTLTHVSSVRHYDITQETTGIGLDNAQVRFYFGCAGDNDQVNDAPYLAIAKDDGAGNWVDLSGTASSAICDGSWLSGDILSDNFTSFSKFVLANKNDGTNVLLVELLVFDAFQEDEHVKIIWTTLTETNNDYFTIEKTIDGMDFEVVDYAEGAGNSIFPRNYSLIDYEPYVGVSYYRLTQTDFDGQKKSFYLVPVYFAPLKSEVSVKVYPNPTIYSEFTIQIDNAGDENVYIHIFDRLANHIYSEKYKSEDNQQIIVTAADIHHTLPSGLYTIVVSGENFKISHELIVL